ncbi:MAG: penicillin acylase family protein [Desulfobacterium sp.]|nr:penicillin acylase family protein [Desulfobacterium sp.]
MIHAIKRLRTSLFILAISLAGLLLVVDSASAFNWAAGIKNIFNPITTTRDDKGVWYVNGDDSASMYDVFEAVGYAVATDRLWQAEKYRRMGRGTLSEIFGPNLVDSDIKVRTTGYSLTEYQDGFAALDQESRDTINGYVAGFNRRIAEVKKDRTLMPFEFKAMGAKLGIDYYPADWSYVDVLAWATNMLRFFDGEATGRGQIDNSALYQTLAAQFPADFQMMFQDLRWNEDPDAVTYIEDETVAASSLNGKKDRMASHNEVPRFPSSMDTILGNKLYDYSAISSKMRQKQADIIASLKEINAYVKMGSYAWVVSGDKTASGNPILYSGPQMDHAFDFSVPSIVTEGSLKAGGLNISGMTIPGMPAIVIGRTPHHAWSMQVGHAHTLDYFLDDASTMFLHRTEVIKVAGQDDVTLPVYRTPNGPVINSNPVISWKYSHWGKEFQIIRAYLDLARATSMDQFGDAISKVTLSQHYCYADRDGNIAYWMSGYDPVRSPGADTRFPQAEKWPEPLTYKPISTGRNAKRGFYSGWNSRSSQAYGNSANNPSYYFGPFHRAHVLEDYLSTHDNLTFEEVRDLALYISTTDSIRTEFLSSDSDTYGDGGNPWLFVKNDFTAAVQASPTPDRTAALAILDNWDGHFVEGGKDLWANGTDRSDAWILMNQWISSVLKMTFEDELGSGESNIVLFNVLLHGLPGYTTRITNLYNWFENKADGTAPQTAGDIIVAALDKALADLGARPWGESKRGKITYTHEMLGALHSIPTSSRSTYAHCVEMGASGPVRIESMLPLGESGTILMDATGAPVFDPNFFSMSPVYDGFQHRTFPLTD